jgi:hypothetical protein
MSKINFDDLEIGKNYKVMVVSMVGDDYDIEYSKITSIEDESTNPVLKGGKRRKSIRRKN